MDYKPIVFDKEYSAFEYGPDDWDPFATTLVFDDKNWMHYTLTADLPTKAYGKIRLKFEYCGCETCHLEINNLQGHYKDARYITVFEFSAELFKKHIINFMERHISSWDEEYAFTGEKEVVAFYNAVLTAPDTKLLRDWA